jgi:tetratricopeptide (TPR) repeat protein
MRWLVLFSSLVSAAAQPRQDLMADTLAAQRRYLEADAAYTELLHSKPDAPEILLKRGAIRIYLGRYTEARTDLEDSLARAPSQAGLGSAHAQLGLLEQIQGRYAAARNPQCWYAAQLVEERASAISVGRQNDRDRLTALTAPIAARRLCMGGFCTPGT